VVLCSEQKLKRSHSLLYIDGKTTGQQPVLSSYPIVDAVLQLELLINKLEQDVANLVKDVASKKMVKIRIFVFFFP